MPRLRPARMKDAERTEFAEAHNVAANSALGQGLVQDAVEAYTKAIDCAHDGLPRLAVYYANRSQARLRLEQYELAGYDASFALLLDPALWKARWSCFLF